MSNYPFLYSEGWAGMIFPGGYFVFEWIRGAGRKWVCPQGRDCSAAVSLRDD